MQRNIVQRRAIDQGLVTDTIHPILRRIYAARGVQSEADLDYSLHNLAAPEQLKGMTQAVQLLEQAICSKKHILIIGDFDTDGATSCALAIKILRQLQVATVDYLVPNRFEHGYGLSPEIVQQAHKQQAELIITVDNGISSTEGVKYARDLGMDVLITDHHLAGPTLPDATVIINPNQPGCPFPNKNLAGVGVIFNVMIALRTHLKTQYPDRQYPNLAQVLDLVALGTVADMVPLNYNNRIMVSQGIARIRARQCCPAILALLKRANKSEKNVSAEDLVFSVAPKLNAAGRLSDMSLGIECLLAEDLQKAHQIASELNQLNTKRHQIQQEMEEQALQAVEHTVNSNNLPAGLCLYHKDWHQGIVGILASRVKEKYHRPTIVFARDQDPDLVKGSARSISGVHIRDVLETIATKNPNIIEKFGGHAMAAGLTLKFSYLPQFQEIFNAEILQNIDPSQLEEKLLTDGELQEQDLNLAMANTLQSAGPWGLGFPEPYFYGEFKVFKSNVIAKKHLKLQLIKTTGGSIISAIAFNFGQYEIKISENSKLKIVYRMASNTYQGDHKLQLIIEHMEQLDPN